MKKEINICDRQYLIYSKILNDPYPSLSFSKDQYEYKKADTIVKKRELLSLITFFIKYLQPLTICVEKENYWNK